MGASGRALSDFLERYADQWTTKVCSTFYPDGYGPNRGDLKRAASGTHFYVRELSIRPAPDREPNQHHEYGTDDERQHVLEVFRQEWSPLSRYGQSNHQPPACLLDLRPIPGGSRLALLGEPR
jgi:hypothetical protein